MSQRETVNDKERRNFVGKRNQKVRISQGRERENKVTQRRTDRGQDEWGLRSVWVFVSVQVCSGTYAPPNQLCIY